MFIIKPLTQVESDNAPLSATYSASRAAPDRGRKPLSFHGEKPQGESWGEAGGAFDVNIGKLSGKLGSIIRRANPSMLWKNSFVSTMVRWSAPSPSANEAMASSATQYYE